MEHRLVVCCFSLVHPGRLMAGTYKSPMKGKENHLNQTSMRTCSILIFRGVSTFKWKKKQPNNSDCGWRESCTTWQVWNPVYAGIYYISTHQSRVSFTNTLFAPKLEGPAGQILSVCFSIFFGNHLAVKGKDLIFPVSFQKKYRPSQDLWKLNASTTQGTDSEDDHCVTLQRMERPATLVLFSVRSPGVLGGRHRQFPRVFWIRTAHLMAIKYIYTPLKVTFRTCQKAGPQKERIVFQASIFRCYLSFSESTTKKFI